MQTDKSPRIRPTPTSSERPFEIEELFFSTTDKRGIITNGNDVFMRISGYSSSEMIQAPHNIIRHPDMPRCVFKLLWNTIESNQMIAAYVKNMAKDGSFYWVLAVVFPFKDGYLSVRLKPTTSVFPIVRDLYRELLEIEKSETSIKLGMEKSTERLLERLQALGFKSYFDFFTHILQEEIQSRDNELKKQRSRHADTERPLSWSEAEDEKHRETIAKMSHHVRLASQTSLFLFERLKDFDTANANFKAKSEHILDHFEQFQCLSLNMHVSSSNFGTNGSTLGVVAQNAQQTAKEIQKIITGFFEQAQKIDQIVTELKQKILSLKLQTDMIEFFVKESSLNQSSVAFQKSSLIFTEVLTSLFERFTRLETDANTAVSSIVRSNKDIRKSVNAIELIFQIGNVEAARQLEGGSSFKVYLDGMKSFSDNLRANMTSLQGSSAQLQEILLQVQGKITTAFTNCIEILNHAEGHLPKTEIGLAIVENESQEVTPHVSHPSESLDSQEEVEPSLMAA